MLPMRPTHLWPAAIACLLVLLPGTPRSVAAPNDNDLPAGPRKAAWEQVEQALEEGKPKSAAKALAGIEQAAIAEKAWGEAARAIATQARTDTGDAAPDEPDLVIRLVTAIDEAPEETRQVLSAIAANWTWSYYQANAWRYRQRTAGGADPTDLTSMGAWDLTTILAEIRRRFDAALGDPGSPAERALQTMPVAEWDALIEKGSMPDAWRPTVWDVLVRDAIAVTSSADAGLTAPEDAFELEASSPALGSLEEFFAWRPEADESVTDRDSMLLETVVLYRRLLEFHRNDEDPSALLSADLDRILWAAEASVGEETEARKEAALRAFRERAGDHETAVLAAFHLASLLQGRGDFTEARAIAAAAAKASPESHGGAMCANLVSQIEAKTLSLATERSWAAPFPSIRVTYRNLERVHLRLCRADWRGRLEAGKPHAGWLDAQDRKAILALPPLREHAADLPATPDYRQRSEEIPVAVAFDAATLEPGAYWLISSHKPDFSGDDNLVAATIVWVTQLGIVTETPPPVFSDDSRNGGRRQPGRISGTVVDLASGEPVAAANVELYLDQRGLQPARGGQTGYAKTAAVKTGKDGRFDLPAEPGRGAVLVATAATSGREQTATSGPTRPQTRTLQPRVSSIVLVTDRGIHRPGQTVFYKGIVCRGDQATGTYAAVEGVAVEVTLRDANGREIATAKHEANGNGSFHGSFAIPAGCLPGQWTIQARAPQASGGVAVRVEEYKRPKFRVELAAPQTSVPLGGEATLTGTAKTYTGLPVAAATVRWRVERRVRFPVWCRCFFPWLPFEGGAQRIARGTATTDDNGSFRVSFPARPDRSVPRESLPVFSFEVVADVTDGGGETRSDERTVNLGYTDVEASVSADDWQAAIDGEPAAVAITVATTTLDGEPAAAQGRLTVRRLVQPAKVSRGDLGGRPPMPLPRVGGAFSRDDTAPPEPRPADPETWADGETIFDEPLATDDNGKRVATVKLPAGIYRASFEIPAAGGVPAVRGVRLVEVIDPDATNYGVKRAFTMRAEAKVVDPGEAFTAIIGTGYPTGRAVVEISQSGRVLERFWSEPGRTQWPVRFKVGEANRGGFTVTAWMVREGRLHVERQVVDVPWTNKKLAIEWERFTRRTRPGAKEIWRARITTVSGKPLPVSAEMLAVLYDASLDQLAPHAWPSTGLAGIFRRERGGVNLGFTNAADGLRTILGGFKLASRRVPPMTFRELRDPFGPTSWLFSQPRMMAAGAVLPAGAPMAMEMADGALATKAAARQMGEADRTKANNGDGGDAGQASSRADAPPPRRNLVETAFFLPSLSSDDDGIVTIEFTPPDTLTTWQFKGLAHDAALQSGTLEDSCISAKDLMVEPLVPRFLREGDLVRIPVKVSNTSTGRLAGTVRLSLADARTDASQNSLIDGPREQSFDLRSGESKPVVFTVKVADGTGVLRYLATGSADASGKRAADGEEALLAVLPRRVPVTETVPITIRGPATKKVSLTQLAESQGTDIQSQSLVVQAASNPAWYAVLALPVIMETADESSETLFTRLYANTLARHLATSDPRIGRIFEQWKCTDSLTSPLENNSDLVQTLLAETPWVREAVDETEARARIALLFDANRAANEARAALERLENLRNRDGGWPWFPGGRTCDSVTLGIVAGFGRLRAAGVEVDVDPALRAISWLDGRLIEEQKRALERWRDEPDEIVLTPIGVSALYARSFFNEDRPPQGQATKAIQWALDVAKRSWMKIEPRLSQGQLAIALHRLGDRKTALSIIESLRERAVDADVQPGDEADSWQGMWWRDRHPGWWSWAHAPIATQAIMIEAFDEVAGDAAAVESLKVWLLSQKRTSRWAGSRATADAVGALLGRGDDLLASQELVRVRVGDEEIVPGDLEAGTGFFETRFVRREIEPGMASITLEKPDRGLAFGGVHWLYLDDIANVPAAGRDELAVEKKVFLKRFTEAGPELIPVGDGMAVEVGDELVVRLVVTSDRDYEFLELADHRPSLTEPVDLLSGWRWADGAAWYMATRDASTQLFFERLPRGTHVFEYSLRAAHRGTASSGFATIQSRYAPEFSARSASVAIEVR